jgi:eukaryotic-like serine/threonine-protein kinase
METAPIRIGRYELRERVGEGSLGVVYRGQDTLLGREVAVKLMAPGLLGDAAAHQRFFSEARAAARLQHVNIVTVFEFGEHDDTPFIVTEFLRGNSLATRLEAGPPLSLTDKLDVAIQLCAGLEAAHAQGVVHRDVKPGNIWICHDRTVKLLDVGIATAASPSETFDVLGTPGYLAPEQVTGGEVDGRADIFSTGVVFYEMFSGRRPFESDSPTGVMLKIVNELAPPLDDAEVPPGLAPLIVRAMQKSPGARYGKAGELLRELRAVKANLPLPPDPPTVAIDRASLDLPPELLEEEPAAVAPPRPIVAPASQPVAIPLQYIVAAIGVVILLFVVLIWFVIR